MGPECQLTDHKLFHNLVHPNLCPSSPLQVRISDFRSRDHAHEVVDCKKLKHLFSEQNSFAHLVGINLLGLLLIMDTIFTQCFSFPLAVKKAELHSLVTLVGIYNFAAVAFIQPPCVCFSCRKMNDTISRISVSFS